MTATESGVGGKKKKGKHGKHDKTYKKYDGGDGGGDGSDSSSSSSDSSSEDDERGRRRRHIHTIVSKEKDADNVKIMALPTATGYRSWLVGVYTEICAATNDRDDCLEFLKRIEDAIGTYDELANKGLFRK